MGSRGCSRPSPCHHGQVNQKEEANPVRSSLRSLSSSLPDEACVGSLLGFLTPRASMVASISLPQLPMIPRHPILLRLTLQSQPQGPLLFIPWPDLLGPLSSHHHSL